MAARRRSDRHGWRTRGVRDGGNPKQLVGDATTNLPANASASAAVASGDELSVVIGLIESSNWSENSLSGVVDINATAYDVCAWINSDPK